MSVDSRERNVTKEINTNNLGNIMFVLTSFFTNLSLTFPFPETYVCKVVIMGGGGRDSY